MLCGVSGLAFAIGVYLPLATMSPIYVGGCVRALAERGRPRRRRASADTGVLAASGLVAGEGLAGVLVAALVATGVVSKPATKLPPSEAGIAVALTVALLILAFLHRGGRARSR